MNFGFQRYAADWEIQEDTARLFAFEPEWGDFFAEAAPIGMGHRVAAPTVAPATPATRTAARSSTGPMCTIRSGV